MLVLGRTRRTGPWAMLHVTWTEWKNLFSLEIYCRTAKLQVDGLARSYGPQRLRIYAMKPELGPPEVEEIDYPAEDGSWERSGALSPRPFGGEMGLHSPATSTLRPTGGGASRRPTTGRDAARHTER